MDIQKINSFFVGLLKNQNFKPIVGSLITCVVIGMLYISIADITGPVHQRATANNNTTRTRLILTRLPGSRFGPIVKAEDPSIGSSALGESIPQTDRTSKTPIFSEKVYSTMWKGAVPINEDANANAQAQTNESSALVDRFYRSQEARRLRFG